MRTIRIAPLALVTFSLACSASFEPECEGEYLVFDYVFDGEPGTTGCVPAAGVTGRTVHGEYLVSHFWYGPEVIRAENRWEIMALPSEILCGAGMEFRNTPLSTGASGASQPLVPYGVTERSEVGVILLYNTTPDGRPCGEGATLIDDAVTTGGTWHVIQGGGPGDWVVVEARDVTFEPILGHTFRFDRMRWYVQLPPSDP